jgi:hypothetical protein
MLAPSEMQVAAENVAIAVSTTCLVVRLVLTEVREVVRVVKTLRHTPARRASGSRRNAGKM